MHRNGEQTMSLKSLSSAELQALENLLGTVELHETTLLDALAEARYQGRIDTPSLARALAAIVGALDRCKRVGI
jgi:hypothetical protein